MLIVSDNSVENAGFHRISQDFTGSRGPISRPGTFKLFTVAVVKVVNDRARKLVIDSATVYIPRSSTRP